MKFVLLFVMLAIFSTFVPVESSKALNKMKKQIKKLENQLKTMKKMFNKKVDKVIIKSIVLFGKKEGNWEDWITVPAPIMNVASVQIYLYCVNILI